METIEWKNHQNPNLEPGVLEDFGGGDSLVRIDFQQLADEVFSLLGDGSKQLWVEYIVGAENLVP